MKYFHGMLMPILISIGSVVTTIGCGSASQSSPASTENDTGHLSAPRVSSSSPSEQDRVEPKQQSSHSIAAERAVDDSHQTNSAETPEQATTQHARSPSVTLSNDRSDFPNPYYDKTEWKVWADDDSPVRIAGQSVSAPPPSKRLVPIKFAELGKFGFQPSSESRTETELAGYWDDIYSSHDKFHSTFPKKYTCRNGEVIEFGDSITRIDRLPMKPAGVNFTSQSTTLMGHDIANSGERLAVIEREFYFSNVLCSAPANRSFQAGNRVSSRDNYEALVPCMYNSIGASSSEVQAMAKMAIAGAYLNRELKSQMKRHGIYPACLLYLWKSSLPYDVPYDHELRHRVAYYSDGLNLPKYDPPKTGSGFWSRAYDEQAHLEAMVRRAQELESAPPIPVLTLESQSGGELRYALYSTILVHQESGEDVELVISTAASYDIQGHDLTVRLTQICGNPESTIEDLGEGRFRIRVPWNEALPRGRTSILLIANNGESDSNPAVINIFKRDGTPNRRPVFETIEPVKVLPGETVELPVRCSDPDGFDVRISRPANEVGELSDGQFKWTTDANADTGTSFVTLIASDNTSGSSLEAQRFPIHVRRTISTFSANQLSGTAPLTVELDASGSRDASGGRLEFQWDFDDGTTDDGLHSTHIYSTPGVYRVRLNVTGPSGQDEFIRHVEVLPSPNARVSEEGWTKDGLKQEHWKIGHRSVKTSVDENGVLFIDGRGGKASSFLEYQANVSMPYAVEMVYRGIDRRGEGLEINPNTFLGMPDRKNVNRRRERGFSVHTETDSAGAAPSNQFLEYDVNEEGFPSRLRVYVTKSPGSDAHMRISGVLINELGSHFFVLNRQDVNESPLRLFSPDRMSVHQFRVTHWD